MDPDEVSRLVEELKLSNDAGEAVIDMEKTEEEMEFEGSKFDKMVVGKIFSTRVVNRENMKSQLPRILQMRGEPDIEIVGDNLFVVIFANERDRRHALVDGPWHLFDNLMLFKEPKGLQKPSDVEFSTYTTWIQCHNLPIVCMNPLMITRIAEHVGTVEEDGAEKHIILIMYERLPEFCTACGWVGHEVRHCSDRTVDKTK